MKTMIFSAQDNFLSCTAKQKFIRAISLSAALLLAVITVFLYFSSIEFEVNEKIEYPIVKDELEEHSPYVQQFDAFMKGQTHIDIRASKLLALLDNPYDAEERDSHVLLNYLYDRVYFDGSYYSYFGTAPIFTVMFPYYALTGALPADSTVQLIFMLVFAVFMTLTVFIIVERLAKNISPLLTALLAYTANVCSLQMLFARGRLEFYYIAATSSMAFASVFAYLFFKGIFAKKTKNRAILFLISGLFFALCFHSRVNTALTLAFFIIPVILFGIVLKKREYTEEQSSPNRIVSFCKKHRVGSIAIELGALALFVIVGIALAFVYNHIRFGNIFEFGAQYQLTIGDATKYKLDITEFGHSVVHYFLMPLNRSDGTAFSYYNPELSRYLYVDAHFGIFEIPLTLAAFICPIAFFDKKRSAMLKYSTTLAIIGCFAVAWIDFCLGGVIFRYLCDISGVLAVLGAIGLALMLDKICTLKKPVVKHLLISTAVLFLIISVCRVFSIMAIDNGNLLALDENSVFYLFTLIP